MTRRCLVVAAICSFSLLTVGFSGCQSTQSSGNHPPTVKATGTVRYQGRPVEGAEVTFNNPSANYSGTAKTNSAGRFVLSTFGKDDGVVPGKQLVAIRRVDVIDKTPPNVDVSAGGVALPPEVHWIIPQKYSDFTKSGLTAEVTESGPNDFTFDLQ